MPTTYAYKVRDREGKMAAGAMEAESEQAVVTRLRQMGYAPISIEQEKGAGLKSEVRLPGTGRVKLKDLAVFSRQFATMINSGLSLLRALTILGEQTSNRRLGEVITQVRAEVEKGSSLSAAMARHPKIFNRLYVSMVGAGKIRSAMTYPVVVFIMVIGIVAACAAFCCSSACSSSCSASGRPARRAATSGTGSSSRSRCSARCSTRAPFPGSPAPWPP